jgi:hypothetical protein
MGRIAGLHTSSLTLMVPLFLSLFPCSIMSSHCLLVCNMRQGVLASMLRLLRAYMLLSACIRDTYQPAFVVLVNVASSGLLQCSCVP